MESDYIMTPISLNVRSNKQISLLNNYPKLHFVEQQKHTVYFKYHICPISYNSSAAHTQAESLLLHIVHLFLYDECCAWPYTTVIALDVFQSQI